jgi:hypothetical protein
VLAAFGAISGMYELHRGTGIEVSKPGIDSTKSNEFTDRISTRFLKHVLVHNEEHDPRIVLER